VTDRAGPPAFEIRPVTIDDLEPLVDIYLDTAVHHAAIDPDRFRVPSRADVAARLRPRVEGRGPRAEYVAAIVDDRMVGSASMSIDDLPHPGSMAAQRRVAEFGVSVRSDWRRRGIGRALIEHLERWAADHGADEVMLEVSTANPDAIRLYRSMGYVDTGRTMRKPAAVER
jgi:GNAT superfamily N-acetyltransferase